MCDSQSMKNKTIFISYHHAEKELCDELKKALSTYFSSDKSSNKDPIYMADDNLFAGAEWLNEIRKRLFDCSLFIVVCSKTSVKRAWLAFESGFAAANSKCNILLFCHSGMTKSTLPEYLTEGLILKNASGSQGTRTYSVVEANCECPIEKLYTSAFPDDKHPSTNFKKYESRFREKLIENTGVPYRGKNREDFPKFQSCTFTRNVNASSLEAAVNPDIVINISKCKPEQKGHPDRNANIRQAAENETERLRLLKYMNSFIAREYDQPNSLTLDTGIAIGIQNCLYDFNKREIYVGVRFKSNIDATQSQLDLAKGEFNTGYQLVRDETDQREKVKSVDTLQDLFSSNTLKHKVEPYPGILVEEMREYKSNIVYNHINDVLERFGSRLFRIQLQSREDGTAEQAYASLFINNSCWYPRFEIGVWKYIDITGYEKEIIDNKEVYDKYFKEGFGEDLFQDYRGNIEDPASELNFWVWAKDGKIEYRSYPEERYIPRHVPSRKMRPQCHSTLSSSNDLQVHYGISDDCTQFIPDESIRTFDLSRIIHTQSGQPATRLLTWF